MYRTYSPCDISVRREYSTLCNPEQVIKCSDNPTSIAINESGDIYVTCYSGQCICVFDQAGQHKITISSFRSGIGPHGVFIKRDVMYVAEFRNHCIQKLTTGGQFMLKFGQHGSGQGQFNGPVSVIVDQRNRLMVSDFYDHRVVILDQAGTLPIDH